tara:strand:- start:114 stop:383 length:270 start_codon:yes stop_codon:yes gene_type:complete
MALASCSGEYDLMSNKPFRMTCEAELMGGEISRFTLDADPQLLQATFQVDDGPTGAWDLVANTPVVLRYRRLEIGVGNFLEETFVINKK